MTTRPPMRGKFRPATRARSGAPKRAVCKRRWSHQWHGRALRSAATTGNCQRCRRREDRARRAPSRLRHCPAAKRSCSPRNRDRSRDRCAAGCPPHARLAPDLRGCPRFADPAKRWWVRSGRRWRGPRPRRSRAGWPGRTRSPAADHGEIIVQLQIHSRLSASAGDRLRGRQHPGHQGAGRQRPGQDRARPAPRHHAQGADNREDRDEVDRRDRP